MIYETEHDQNINRVEAERDKDDVERLIDEAAMRFARLFLDQCTYAKQPKKRDISIIDCNGPL